MPKTHTDDIAPALPSAIDGPLTIVDPSDSASWIKIEPADARIAAAGGARPVRSVATGYDRTYLSATGHHIGTAMVAHYVNAGTNGGIYLTPFHIPDDMDVGEPCRVKILVTAQANAEINGQVVRFALACTQVTEGGSKSEHTLTMDWDVPDDWSTTDLDLIMIDNGNGRSFEANTFANGDVLGMRLARMGAAPEDTFDQAVKMAAWLMLEYTAKEF